MAETHYLKKSLVELLEIAKSTGVICGWTVDTQYIVFHTNTAQFSVQAIDAGSFLRQLILNAGETLTSHAAAGIR